MNDGGTTDLRTADIRTADIRTAEIRTADDPEITTVSFVCSGFILY